MNKSDKSEWSWPGIGLLLLVNLVAISFFFSPGTGDVSIWETWMRQIESEGLLGGFAHTGTDYPPLAFIILLAVVRLAQVFGTTHVLILKCSLLFFLFGTTGCFYWFTRSSLLTGALELSLILNSVALGYLDIYFAPFLIAGLFLLQRRHFSLGLLLYAASCAIKWQPLIIAPFVCLYILRGAKEQATESARIWSQVKPFLITVLVLAVPILVVFPFATVVDSFKRALTYHKFLSGYALNLGWLQTWALHFINPDKYGGLLPDGSFDAVNVFDPLVILPNKVLFYLGYAAILISFARGKKSFQQLLTYSMLGYLAYFSFNTGVHENHLFLICCLSWILVVIEPEQLPRCINFNIAANLNLFLFFGAFGQRLSPVIGGIDVTLLFAVANLCLFAGFLIETVKADGLDIWFFRIGPVPPITAG
jgi:hypothetical protein